MLTREEAAEDPEAMDTNWLEVCAAFAIYTVPEAELPISTYELDALPMKIWVVEAVLSP